MDFGTMEAEVKGFLIPPMANLSWISLALSALSSSVGPKKSTSRGPPGHLFCLLTTSLRRSIRGFSVSSMASAIRALSRGVYSARALDALCLFPASSVRHLWTKDSWAALYLLPSDLVHSLIGRLHLRLAMSRKLSLKDTSLVGFVVSAPYRHWSKSTLKILEGLVRYFIHDVFQISNFPSCTGFSNHHGSSWSAWSLRISAENLNRMLASFSCLFSDSVSLFCGSPSGSTKDLSGLGPGGFSRKGDTVSQGVAAPTTSYTLFLTSALMAFLTFSSRRSVLMGPTLSTTTTIQPSAARNDARSPSLGLPLKSSKARGWSAHSSVLTFVAPYWCSYHFGVGGFGKDGLLSSAVFFLVVSLGGGTSFAGFLFGGDREGVLGRSLPREDCLLVVSFSWGGFWTSRVPVSGREMAWLLVWILGAPKLSSATEGPFGLSCGADPSWGHSFFFLHVVAAWGPKHKLHWCDRLFVHFDWALPFPHVPLLNFWHIWMPFLFKA